MYKDFFLPSNKCVKKKLIPNSFKISCLSLFVDFMMAIHERNVIIVRTAPSGDVVLHYSSFHFIRKKERESLQFFVDGRERGGEREVWLYCEKSSYNW